MKIILQREVGKLGTPGDLVEVADGYARNYLLPRGLAIPASKGAVRHAERLRSVHEDRVRRARVDAEATAGRLGAVIVRITARAGEEGRLFGQVTPERLAEEITRVTRVPVDRRRIHLEEPIRSLGSHQVSVQVHPEVAATVNVEVVAE
ncbi:MAG TPA: 50S ribosomal protein L9 [Actinomycetota bacterium]|nr:50S ribosomal protein L9 [Actinomycetota bacterium]